MSDGAKELLKKTWGKISLGFLKAFRGLVCEKKDGGWELSKGRAAFWLVFSHCMYVWNGGAKAAKAIANTAVDAAAATTEVATDIAADVVPAASVATETAANAISTMSMSTGVPEQEFYLLMALLGYSAIKTTKGGLTNALGALRGNKQ